jgi:hypothetical protein
VISCGTVSNRELSASFTSLIMDREAGRGVTLQHAGAWLGQSIALLAGNPEAQLIIKPLPKHLQLTPLQPAAKVGVSCWPACSSPNTQLS